MGSKIQTFIFSSYLSGEYPIKFSHIKQKNVIFFSFTLSLYYLYANENISLMRYPLTIFTVLFSIFFAHASDTPRIIPQPTTVNVAGQGFFMFTEKTVFAVENEEQAAFTQTFLNLFTNAAGYTPKLKVDSKRGDVVFKTEASLAKESYRLVITSKKITVSASDNRGFFYALQTIRQLLAPALESSQKVEVGWTIPAMTITDNPRFAYRGLMIDVARYFLPKENLLKVIDCMAMLKLNKLHLHLTDDNGWRIEIKKYPLLTEVGSRRVERKDTPFPARKNARQGEPTVEKGFYTQDDIKEIVAYAGQRQIDVIPEIEMPAHSNAALAAYPLLACPSVDKFIGVLPGLGGNHADIVYCAGNDEVFTFIQQVLDEVMELFPSHYIHLGGDEVNTSNWEQCPLCRARMKQEQIHDVADLQGYFMNRVNTYVRSKGREMMGWDELTRSKLPEGSVIFGWRGMGKAGLDAARQGHSVVMTPAQVLYLIRYQGPQWFEPLTYFGNNTLKDVYSYEPAGRDWTAKEKKQLLGIQGSLWTEFCSSPKDVEYLLFPRLAALAEASWSSVVNKNWKLFLGALDSFVERLRFKGIQVAQSMFNIQHQVLPGNEGLEVSLDCIRPDVEIRYTLDGSTPTGSSDLYERKIQIREDTQLKAATFAEGVMKGKVLSIPIQFNKATAKRLLRGKDKERVLLNGVRGSMKYTDGEWAGWEQNDSIAMTFDLRQRISVSTVQLGCMNNFGMAVHKPRTVEVWLSDDDLDYWKVSQKEFEDDEIFKEDTSIEDIQLSVQESARYVRLVLKGGGKCPPTHVRPGQEAKVYVDEIIIK